MDFFEKKKKKKVESSFENFILKQVLKRVALEFFLYTQFELDLKLYAKKFQVSKVHLWWKILS